MGTLTRRFYVKTVEFTTGICDGIDPLKEGGNASINLEIGGYFWKDWTCSGLETII